jgi:hypothetical protein
MHANLLKKPMKPATVGSLDRATGYVAMEPVGPILSRSIAVSTEHSIRFEFDDFGGATGHQETLAKTQLSVNSMG